MSDINQLNEVESKLSEKKPVTSMDNQQDKLFSSTCQTELFGQLITHPFTYVGLDLISTNMNWLPCICSLDSL